MKIVTAAVLSASAALYAGTGSNSSPGEAAQSAEVDVQKPVQSQVKVELTKDGLDVRSSANKPMFIRRDGKIVIVAAE